MWTAGDNLYFSDLVVCVHVLRSAVIDVCILSSEAIMYACMLDWRLCILLNKWNDLCTKAGSDIMNVSLRATPPLPCARSFAVCTLSGTRQTDSLSCA